MLLQYLVLLVLSTSDPISCIICCLHTFSALMFSFPRLHMVVYLVRSNKHRSTSNIVKAAQKVISHSKSGSGADKLRKDMKPKRGSGKAPRIVSFENDKAEGKKGNRL